MLQTPGGGARGCGFLKILTNLESLAAGRARVGRRPRLSEKLACSKRDWFVDGELLQLLKICAVLVFIQSCCIFFKIQILKDKNGQTKPTRACVGACGACGLGLSIFLSSFFSLCYSLSSFCLWCGV